MLLDCTTCGACCSISADWPRIQTDRDRGPEGPPRHMRNDDDSAMRCAGDRCVALEGAIGQRVVCTIYERRPSTCRDCEAGSVSCLVARTAHGLAVPALTSPLDALLRPT
jgi:uncharacterized protein